MAGGGILQIQAVGAQDLYISGKPQVTFFKTVYKRHSNFSMESIEQTFNGAADWGRKVTCTLSRNGDLVSKTYLQVTVPSVTVIENQSFRWVNWLGHALIKNVSIEVGGQTIDKHYGEWLHIWNELTQKPGQQAGYADMVGNVPALTQLYTVANGGNPITVPSMTLYIPLQFWFCRFYGQALPLLALQFHEVKISVEFRELRHCCYSSGNVVVPSIPAASLYTDFIYLDASERKKFANSPHEYLFDQLSFTGDESVTNSNSKIKVNLNHPQRALYWVVQPEKNLTGNGLKGAQWFNFTDAIDLTPYTGTPSPHLGGGMGGASAANPFNPAASSLGGDPSGVDVDQVFNHGAETSIYDMGKNPTAVAKLMLNSHDRMSEREGRYFNLVQPYQHHTNSPATGINVYSFAMNPEEHQPSGSCNFSRIDNAVLQLQLTPEAAAEACRVKVFGHGMNIFRVAGGLGGVAFAS